MKQIISDLDTGSKLENDFVLANEKILKFRDEYFIEALEGFLRIMQGN